MGEFDLIAWIRARSSTGPQVAFGIGDDCAGLSFTPGAEVLVTTDMLLDGRHFRLGEATPEEVGYKALAVNLSDIAAMAGTPVAAVVAVALPKQNGPTIARGLHAGITSLAEHFGIHLVGGDTNAWDGPLVISITLLGEVEKGRAIRRNGATPGDSIFVTGPLGGSFLGRHLRPNPRVGEAIALAKLVDIHAMIDISDGLAADLRHILEESGGLGAVLDSDSVPIHADSLAMAAFDARSPLDHALSDGEDFELCFTISSKDADRLTEKFDWVKKIGEITAEPGLRLRDADGTLSPVIVRGFDHFLDITKSIPPELRSGASH